MNNNSWYENGELPPVGAECLHQENITWNMETNKFKVKVIARDGEGVVITTGNGRYTFEYNPAMFSPIQSKADIERDEAVGAMWAEVNHLEDVSNICEALHDAGYRKYGEEVKPPAIVDFVENRTQFMMARSVAEKLLKHFHIFKKKEK